MKQEKVNSPTPDLSQVLFNCHVENITAGSLKYTAPLKGIYEVDGEIVELNPGDFVYFNKGIHLLPK